MKFFEDIAVGEEVALGSHTFTAEEIVAFATRWDCQPFHVDEAAAAAGPFGALAASGWHTVCAWMRLNVDHVKRLADQRRAAGLDVAELGPSPGFTDMQLHRPVLAGDTIAYSTRVIATRALATQPRWGLVTSRNEGINQHGELVFAFTGNAFVERRDGGPWPDGRNQPIPRPGSHRT